MPDKPITEEKPFQVVQLADGPASIEVSYLLNETLWRAVGKCPRCSHTTQRDYRITALTAAAEGGMEVDYEPLDKDGPNWRTMSCSCGTKHEDVPDDDSGCGAYWRVELK